MVRTGYYLNRKRKGIITLYGSLISTPSWRTELLHTLLMHNLPMVEESQSICVPMLCLFYFSCHVVFFFHVVFKLLYRFWNVFFFIYTILTYLCSYIVFILLSALCCVFYRVLIIFSYRVTISCIILSSLHQRHSYNKMGMHP